MKGTIEKRDIFLRHIANKLHRATEEKVITPEWKHQPQWGVYKGISQDELVAVMKKACESIHTQVYETDSAQLAATLGNVIADYGSGSIVATRDERFSKFGLDEVLKKNQVYTWDVSEGHRNIEIAAEADIGLSICDVMLAESASAGLFNDKDKARSVSLLPVTSIVIVPESLIVPRLTQAMQRVEKKVKAGDEVSTYINFISGPSNSADIEMRLVVGVHGPVKVAYIVVNDL